MANTANPFFEGRGYQREIDNFLELIHGLAASHPVSDSTHHNHPPFCAPPQEVEGLHDLCVRRIGGVTHLGLEAPLPARVCLRSADFCMYAVDIFSLFSGPSLARVELIRPSSSLLTIQEGPCRHSKRKVSSLFVSRDCGCVGVLPHGGMFLRHDLPSRNVYSTNRGNSTASLAADDAVDSDHIGRRAPFLTIENWKMYYSRRLRYLWRG
ncbi:hypothetical protein EI94DRAFT_305850 [Lactarius quietus]|nr:hypothetical protein EI94DRAFT_305850 [Lactarius quietus]